MFIMEENAKKQKTQADIRIVGVGGGGNNALETMIQQGIQGVQFIAVNTDHQALESSSAQIKIQIGSKLTKGLGAGANPEVGRRAAVESYEEIVKALQGSDMVFITAGMGGGTGTGGAPFVAQAANELGLLTVGIVTTPFLFEGRKRGKQAEQGIQELRSHVDTLIVIPNEKLLTVSKKDTPLLETFKMTDEVLLQAVKGIAELVSVPGLINLDFSDIKTVMKDKGMALMGRGLAEGEDRAEKAVRSAVSSPLLEGVSIKGATGMIVNITSDSSLSLSEVQSASMALTQLADPSADIIVGTVIDESMAGRLSVTVIATGFMNHAELKDSSSNPVKTNHSILSENLNEESPSQEQPSQHEELTAQEQLSQDEEAISQEQAAQHEEAISQEQPAQYKEAVSQKQLSQHEGFVVQEPADEESSQLKPEHDITAPSEKSTGSDSKRPSPRDVLLSKAREYAENQKMKGENNSLDKQISMDWEDSSMEEKLSSPFDSSVDFSDKDMI